MPHAEVRTTAFNVSFPRGWSSHRRWSHARHEVGEGEVVPQDPELKLPKLASLLIVLLTSGLLQVRCYAILSRLETEMVI